MVHNHHRKTWIALLCALVSCVYVGCTQKRFSVDQFERLIKGKNEQELIAMIGKPKRIVNRQEDHSAFWYYVYKVYDPATGNPVPMAEVEFKGGVVAAINYDSIHGR